MNTSTMSDAALARELDHTRKELRKKGVNPLTEVYLKSIKYKCLEELHRRGYRDV